MVETTIGEARHKSWRREVMKRADLGNNQEKQKDLELAKYIKEETGRYKKSDQGKNRMGETLG